MSKKIIFSFWLMSSLLISLSTFAQDAEADKQRQADRASAEKTADSQIGNVRRVNDAVNEALASGKLYTHRLTLNSADADAKIWGSLSKYQETANFYFELRDGQPILKKVIIVSEIASRQAYTDFLYDEQGNPILCMYQYDLSKTTEVASRYYYANKRLIQVSKGKTESPEYLYESSFGTQDVQNGIEMIARAESFKKIFDSLVRVQAPATR